MEHNSNIIIGTAGWNIAKEHAHLFEGKGEHLERYAALFQAVEINMTFYRLPKEETVEKWKNMVSDDFRFSVKLSREITHLKYLKDTSLLPAFLERIQHLKPKLGPLLVQLPPRLSFDEKIARDFFEALTSQFDGTVVCEPRHASWFLEASEELLRHFKIHRVAADPAPVPAAATPGGWERIEYYRLHGSPEMYYSSYSEPYLEDLSHNLKAVARKKPVWCIFDNTASGAAVANGLWLQNRLENGPANPATPLS